MISKLDAERGHWVAMRPVLVYGPGVKGNMAALIRLAAKSLNAAPQSRRLNLGVRSY